MGILGRNRLTAGLDIGSGFVKLVVIDHGRPEPELVRVATTPLVPDAIVDGEIIDAVAVADTVRSLVKANGLQGKNVNAAVGGRDVIIKRIQMDRMGEPDARAVIPWEAEQHVPFDMENVLLDFQIMDAEADGPQMTVLLVAAKRELIEGRVQLLADAGLTAATIDVDAFALSNAFEHSYPELLDGLVALVNVGNEKTNVSLLEAGMPLLVRAFPFGSRRLREALQHERGLTAEQAEAVLVGRDDGVKLRRLVREKVDDLAIALERAATFLAAQPGPPRDARRV
ncbi:MAG: type IV pilus assembly protein PilM, partial [Longimicrobiales bacterium]